MINNPWFDGFPVVLEKEESRFKAFFIGLPEIYEEGCCSQEAIIKAKIMWERYKEKCKKNTEEIPLPILEKDYTGQFNVRLDKELHKALVNEAAQHNISLNSLICKKLRQSTVTKKNDYRWNLDKVTVLPVNRAILSFSEEKSNKVGINIGFEGLDVKEVLEFSEEKIMQNINSNKDLNEAFQQFIQDQNFTGFTENPIWCSLVSREMTERYIYQCAKDLKDKFYPLTNFYIARIRY